ncbi:MAG: MFS transporter [Hyphomicrobiaceae bacterium]
MNIHLLGWVTGALFFFYAWVLRVSPSVMVEELMRDFSVGATSVGSLSAFYFYGYAGMQIPVGLMIDRFGPRRLLTISALVCGASCLLAAWSPTFAGVSVGRFLIGASAAFSLVGALAVGGQWFAPTRFALLGGLAMAAGMAGGVLGQAPVRLLVEAHGWRPTVAAMSLGGVLLAVMALAFVRDKTRGSGGFGHVLSGLAEVLRNPQTWLIAIAGLGVNGTLLGFGGLWGVPFMGAAHGLEPASAAFVTSLLIAGWGCGAPLFGWLSGYMGRRRAPFLMGYAICMPSFLLLVYGPPMPTELVAALTFLTGFGGSAQLMCFASVREVNSPALAGTAIGVVNALVTGTGAVYQPLIGSILDHVWSGKVVEGARIYAADDYRAGFSVLVAGLLIGLVCAIATRETRCRPMESTTGGVTPSTA